MDLLGILSFLKVAVVGVASPPTLPCFHSCLLSLEVLRSG